MTTENGIRILAGSLVLAGLALGMRVNTYWFILPGFVGVNLIQSAITGFCPAEMIMKKCGMKSGGGCCS